MYWWYRSTIGTYSKFSKSMISKSSFEWSIINVDTSYCWSASRVHLGLLLFLMYINDLINNLSSTIKLFVDDTSLFCVVYDVNLSEFHLNSDLKKYLNGLINGNCLSILIFLRRLKKLYFQEMLLKHLILQSFLVIFQ